MPSPMNSATERITRKFIGAVKDDWQLYSNTASDYTIGSPIGFGASSIVYAAKFQPSDGSSPIPCALKVLDLDRLPTGSLRLLQRETQLMSLAKHPNVLRVRGTWMDGHKLYIAMRLMNAGSAADVMRYGWPGGMEEEVVKCVLKQALEGINYLHVNGLMHRDVKAANFLIDDDGTVLLGDLGVAVFLWENEDNTTTNSSPSTSKRSVNISSTPTSRFGRTHNASHSHKPRVIGKRKSFVGTPCWMAPEVVNGKQYDSSADIWSFGITALELTQGRAPRSRESPHSVLLHIVQDAPPKLERESGPHKYSRSFQEIVEWCLNKDPSKRPTAEELLQTPFFKSAKKKGYLVGAILSGLPPLTQRQERRKQPSILTHATMESWDFSLTNIGGSIPTSPTTSVYSHHKRHVTTLPRDGVFEIEDDDGEGATSHGGDRKGSGEIIEHEEDAAAYADRIRNTHITTPLDSRSHSRNVSWPEGYSGESQVDGPHSTHPEPIIEVDIPPLSSSPSSDRYVATPSSPSNPLAPKSAPPLGPISISHSSALDVPVSSSHLSSSRAASASSYSSTNSSAPQLITPPSSIPVSTPYPHTSRLWKKLTGRAEDKDREREVNRSGGAQTLRRKGFGGMLSRTAGVANAAGAGLVRTVSRSRNIPDLHSSNKPSK